MKKRPLFNQTIHFRHILFICLLSLSIVSCGTEEIENPQRTYFEIKEKVLQASLENLTIDAAEYSDSLYSISFSNGDGLVVPIDSVTVLTIDLSGCWCVNHDSSLMIRKTENMSAPFNDTNIVIAEGYKDWTFFFSDDEPIILIKTLYSYDADALIKGVNHRGYSKVAPENTLPAFRLSKLQGFNFVEADIRFTSDGIPVLLHDEAIDRTSNGHGKIRDLSYNEVRAFDFGSWKASSFVETRIPTLEEFLSLSAELELSPHLELKTGTKKQVFQIIDMVEHFGLTDNVTYISFSLNLLKYVLEKKPDACIGVLTNSVSESIITKAGSINTVYNHVYIGSSDYSESAVSLCRQAEIPLGVWVIDSKEQILNLPQYVSSVTSDIYHAGRVLYETNQNSCKE